MPPLPRWTTPERPKRQSGEIGRNTATLAELILTEKTHPACMGLSLSRGITPFLSSFFLVIPFFCSSAPGDRQEVGGESPPR
jgi:hypothetical protein